MKKKTTVSIIFLLILGTVFASENKKIEYNKNHPIIVDDELLGGFKNGKWITKNDFIMKHKSNITGHFTFSLNKDWYKVDIDKDGVVLSIFRANVNKPIRCSKVFFEDYMGIKSSYPPPTLLEENRRLN